MSNFSNLLSRETSRKEFLVFLGLLVLSVSGVSGVLKNLLSLDFEKNKSQANVKKVSRVFGKEAYGV